MATNETAVMTSHNLLNYSGMLFNHGNTATPFSTMIGGKSRTANSWEYALSVDFNTDESMTQPSITESASLTAPAREFITRTQETNVCQIFQRALRISYGKQSSMGQLSGLNVEGQAANPATELDFQVAAVMTKLGNIIEHTFLNGAFQKGTHDDVAYKTRGIIPAITTNIKTAGSASLGYWLVTELIEMMASNNAPTDNLVLMCAPVHIMQINADAVANGLTVIPAAREVNGIKIDQLITPFGSIGIVSNRRIAAGTALVFNPVYCAPVYMPVPGKGNFFLEELSKTGASDDYQIYGQAGLDYGNEFLHGKITGLATTFTAPTYGAKVFTVTA